MRRSLRIFFLSLLLILLTPACLLKIPAVNEQVKSLIRGVVKEALGQDIEIKSLSGIPPFFFSATDVVIGSTPDSQLLSASSISFIPEWHELLFGNISFYNVSIGTVEANPEKIKDFLSLQSDVIIPIKKIILRHLSIDSLSIKNNPVSLSVSGACSYSLNDSSWITSLSTKIWPDPSWEYPCNFSLETKGIPTNFSLDGLIEISNQALLSNKTAPSKQNEFQEGFLHIKGTGSFTNPYILSQADVQASCKLRSLLKKIEVSGTIFQEKRINQGTPASYKGNDSSTDQQLKIILNRIDSFIAKPFIQKHILTPDEETSDAIQDILQRNESIKIHSSLEGILSSTQLGPYLDGSLIIEQEKIPFKTSYYKDGLSFASKGSIHNAHINADWVVYLSDIASSAHLQASQINFQSLDLHVGELRVETKQVQDSTDIALTASNFSYDDVHEKTIQALLKKNSTSNLTDFSFQASGDISCAATGNLFVREEEAKIDIQTLRVGNENTREALVLERPTQIAWNKTSLLLDHFILRNKSQGLIEGHISQMGKNLDGNIRAINLPLSKITLAKFIPIHGEHSFSLVLSGTKDTPTGSLSGTMRTVLEASGHDSLSHTTDYKIELNSSAILLHAKANGEGIKNPLEFHANIKRQNQLEKCSILGTLKGDIDLLEWSSLFFPEKLQCEGVVSCKLSLSGALMHPQIKGEVDLIQGKFEIPGTGGILTNISAQGLMHGHRVDINTIKALGETGGEVEGEGFVDWSTKGLVSYDLKFRPKDIELVHTDIGNARASGNLELIGKNNKIDLKGVFKVHQALLDLRSDFSQSAHDLEIEFKDSDESEIMNDPVSLHFDIELPHNGFIEGRGLSSEWKGILSIQGNTNKFKALGSLSCLKGHYHFAGKDLKISRGEILFNGNLMHDSQLNVAANLELPLVSIQTTLNGSFERPELHFYSIPMMTDKDIVSWVLFGKGAQDISPLQSLQLAQAIISIRQPGGPFSFIDTVRSTLGIDRIDVTNDSGSNEVTLQVGKYLSQSVMVTLSKEIASEVNRMGLSVDLHQDIKAEAEVGDDAEGRVSLSWKKDY